MLDPSGERISIIDDSKIAMWLLSAAWQQIPPEAAQLHWKGATTYQP